jgi:hypothetical protein
MQALDFFPFEGLFSPCKGEKRPSKEGKYHAAAGQGKRQVP